jgi:hypothetical protein
MAKIHYFQRYSTPENAVTNNTLQLLHRIYEYSIDKLNLFLCDLLELEEFGVGIEINQQQRGKGSVPDGIVLQRSFKLILESKVSSPVDVAQLVAHGEGFNDEKLKVLVLLTIHPIQKALHNEITERIGKKFPSVIFRSITYGKISEELKGRFEEFEDRIYSIVEDYRAYCRDEELISEAEYLMRIVPTGDSFDLNRQHAMYFDPADRGYSQHAFIGLYKSKSVRSMMKIQSIFDINYENGILHKALISGEDTARFDDRIIAMIGDARKIHYEIAKGHKFFCGDEAYDTSFTKASRNGIQGPRFKDLRDFDVKDFTSAAVVAKQLQGKTWT